MTNYDETLNEIKAIFPKHHLEINLFPSGGMISLWDCDECGSNGSYMETWKISKGQTLDSAIEKLKEMMS